MTYSDGIELEVKESIFPPPSLIVPANVLANQYDPNLRWNVHPSAEMYELQLASDSTFTEIIINATGLIDTHYQTSGFAPLTTYYWRVRALNTWGNETSAPFSCTTRDFTCGVLPSVDVPITIGTDVNTITSTLEITSCGRIVELNVINLDIAHTYIDDLTIDLTEKHRTLCSAQN